MRTVVSRRRRASAKAAPVGVALPVDPSSGIGVPLVASLGYGAEGRLDQIPAVRLVERPQDGSADEAAASAVAGDGVDTGDEGIVEFDVHSHV